MTKTRSLRGIELRYALTMNLALHGAARIPELIESPTACWSKDWDDERTNPAPVR